jgi:hypothetical protein
MATSSRCPSIAETIVADSSFSGLESLASGFHLAFTCSFPLFEMVSLPPRPLAGIQIQPIIATSIALR